MEQAIDTFVRLLMAMGVPERQIPKLVKIIADLRMFSYVEEPVNSTGGPIKKFVSDGIVGKGPNVTVQGGTWLIECTVTRKGSATNVGIDKIHVTPQCVVKEPIEALARIIYKDSSADVGFVEFALTNKDFARFWIARNFTVDERDTPDPRGLWLTFRHRIGQRFRPGTTLDVWGHHEVPPTVEKLITLYGLSLIDLWRNPELRAAFNTYGDLDTATHAIINQYHIFRQGTELLVRMPDRSTRRMSANDFDAEVLPGLPDIQIVRHMHGDRLIERLWQLAPAIR